MQSSGNASDKQRELPLVLPGDEPDAGDRSESESVHLRSLMARVLSRDNLSRALKQVRRNKGAPGIDGMSVDALPDYLREHWPEVRRRLVDGTYRPQPVRRVVIPKPQGGERPLGIPAALDRFIQQAIARLKHHLRRQSRRTRGHSIAQVIAALRETLLDWKAYFGVAEVLSPLRDLDKWIRR
ncbi:group II intron maturase-specific domain-containing protein [Arhodomonas sp. AD133]|uniref:group II intron maturase-specific domain-containing protein n=1 Tax=Arhodomonas sp. AD133 TaxID=3415009 RepID=UPI003EBA4E63